MGAARAPPSSEVNSDEPPQSWGRHAPPPSSEVNSDEPPPTRAAGRGCFVGERFDERRSVRSEGSV
jgi:hypothetical protein